MADWGFETRQVHSGAQPDSATNARAVPIYQTTSYVFRDTEHAANLFALQELGNIYTRIMNPTQAVFEERVAALEGGVGAMATASGQAAETIALLNLAENGGHIVSSASLYGGTYNLLHYTLPKLGVEVTFVDDPDDLKAWHAAIRPNTRAFYGETIGNPKGDVFDFGGVSQIAHKAGIPLVIDNTVATPYLCTPLEYGADIVIHSATKFIGGHGTSIGGIIVDGGHFDYEGSGRFANFTEPDPSYHGLVFSQLPEPLWPARYILKARLQYLRDIGAAISPFNAFLMIQGLETLSLRMERHCANAQIVAEFLESRDEVSWVKFPGLDSSPWHQRRREYLPNGSGAIMAFGIKGGMEAGKRFIEGLELFSHLANVGDVRSLAIHPASTTHSQLSEAEQVSAGVSPDLVRLCIGIESVQDIVADLDAGFRAAKGACEHDADWRSMTFEYRRANTGAWLAGDPAGHRQFVVVHDGEPLALEAGGQLGPITVAYETWGTLNASRTNAVLIEHALTLDSHAHGPAGAGHVEDGWWHPLIGAGEAIDTDAWFVVCPNVLGGCQGTTGPSSLAADDRPYGGRFPLITPRDQVAVEVALTDALGIDRWCAVVGGSMGGMRALEWAVGVPDRTGRAVVCAVGAFATAEQIGLSSTQNRAITVDPHYYGGDYYDAADGPHSGLRTARQIGQISYRSELEFLRRFHRKPQGTEDPLRGGRYAIESYLEHQGDKLVRRFDANTYVVLSTAMNHHDVGRGRGGVADALARVTADVFVAGITTDRLYPLRLQHEIAEMLPGRPAVEVIASVDGHDGFLTETEAVGKFVRGALMG